MHRFVLTTAALLAASILGSPARAGPAPLMTYSLAETTSLALEGQTIEIYRDGDRAVMETNASKQADGTKPPHTRTYYDLKARRSYTINLDNPLVACGVSDLKRAWGDPFADASAMRDELAKQKAKAGGRETVAGVDTRIWVVATPRGSAKLSIDPKSGLLMKWQLVPTDGKPMTVLEVTKFSTAAPPAAMLAVPAACTKASTQDRRIHLTAAPGGGENGVTAAILPPASPKPCTALFRVVRLGSMAPLTGGYQVAIDRSIDAAHPASYRVGLTATGHADFAGGRLTEETAAVKNGILRIENMPPEIHVELCFGKGGCSSVLIYRHCTAPESVLVFSIHNPARVSDGGDWYWLNAPAH